MNFLSLAPFVPSGHDFEKSKNLFIDLGFSLVWDNGDYASFERGTCRFILQKFDNKSSAENFMISVGVDDVAAFRAHVINNGLVEKYNIRVNAVTNQPYGKEVNLIDIAGVCWYFVE